MVVCFVYKTLPVDPTVKVKPLHGTTNSTEHAHPVGKGKLQAGSLVPHVGSTQWIYQLEAMASLTHLT